MDSEDCTFLHVALAYSQHANESWHSSYPTEISLSYMFLRVNPKGDVGKK